MSSNWIQPSVSMNESFLAAASHVCHLLFPSPETKKVVEETIERTQFGVRTEDSAGIPALESRLTGSWLFLKLMAK